MVVADCCYETHYLFHNRCLFKKHLEGIHFSHPRMRKVVVTTNILPSSGNICMFVCFYVEQYKNKIIFLSLLPFCYIFKMQIWKARNIVTHILSPYHTDTTVI